MRTESDRCETYWRTRMPSHGRTQEAPSPGFPVFASRGRRSSSSRCRQLRSCRKLFRVWNPASLANFNQTHLHSGFCRNSARGNKFSLAWGLAFWALLAAAFSWVALRYPAVETPRPDIGAIVHSQSIPAPERMQLSRRLSLSFLSYFNFICGLYGGLISRDPSLQKQDAKGLTSNKHAEEVLIKSNSDTRNYWKRTGIDVPQLSTRRDRRVRD